MLTVFYGENRAKALEAFDKVKSSATVLPPEADLVEVASSQSIFGENFVVLVESLPADLVKKLAKLGAELREFEFSETDKKKREAEKKRENNRIYAFTDQLLVRDRRSLWLAYHEALRQGFEPEELYWKLSAQLKNINLAKQSGSASEAKMHPFVFGKCQSAGEKFSKEELSRLSIELLDLWHDSHTGRKELVLGLEQFILSV